MKTQTQEEHDKKLGATGEFPQGQLDAEDKGEIAIAVTAKEGVVLIDFGSEPITWIGCYPDEARGFATLLLQYADHADEQSK